MTDNFLPKFTWAATVGGKGRKVRCQVRGYDVPATPEEQVRQRVLHWLINTKSWEKVRLELERAYRWESDPNRSHIRPDIELMDENGNVVVVVECKRKEVPLSQAVDDQAKEYAVKSAAPYIWVTNGEEHRFLERVEHQWKEVRSIEPLGEEYEPSTGRIVFPNIRDVAATKRYFEQMCLARLNNEGMTGQRDFTLALYKAIFDPLNDERGRFPYSSDGVYVLEYEGVAFRNFKNRSGGGYHARYADFIAATRGRLEAVSVAVNHGGGDKFYLCVGVSKAERKHHALQLDIRKYSEWDAEKRCWHVWHDGRMPEVKDRTVMDALRESGCGHWIRARRRKEMAYLGELPEAEAVTWENTREFLANLLHYGIIRTNLREAQAVRKA